MRRPIAAVLVACAVLALQSCATSQLYQPADVSAGQAGYAETRLSDTSWRVEFAGDDFTSRETVETYLLYRSAELALENGFDWFASLSAETATDIIVEAAPADYRAHYWQPRWRRRNRFFWSDVDPAGPLRSGSREPQVRTSVHYSATADILLGRGPAPKGGFDARRTLEQLGPSVRPPQ